MPIKRLVNEKCFDIWTPESAYLLGLLMADGTLTTNPRGSRYVEFVSTDRELVDCFRSFMKSNHKISLKKRPASTAMKPWKPMFRIQVGNKKMLSQLSKIGLSKKNIVPQMPKKYYRHFTRGFFDGDGCVVFSQFFRRERQKMQKYFQVLFVSRYRRFLKQLLGVLKCGAKLNGGSLHKGDRCHRLMFCQRDGVKLFDYLYNGVGKGLRLSRKYKIFREGARHFGVVV